MHLRQCGDLYFVNSIGAERTHLVQHARRFIDQSLHVDAHTARRIRLEVIDAAREDNRRSAIIPARDVMEADADLEDAFVKIADGLILFGTPHRFKCFVLVPIFAAIELLKGVEHL